MADERQDTELAPDETGLEAQAQAEAAGVEGFDETQPAGDYQELHNRYLRLAADFENFRKRQAQEREFLLKYGASSALEALLPVLDNLDRAQKSLNETSDPAMLYKSFELMAQQLLDSLGSVGLKKMSPKGETFDPEMHEAISQVENPDVPENTILDVYREGYMLHDRVIRAPQVVVATAPQGAEQGGFEPVAADTKKNNPFQAGPTSQEAEGE